MPVPFRVHVEGAPRTVHPIIQDEIYRIARESLRNAFRHAQARQIETEITYSGSLLRLRFRDDGKGIDPRVLERGGRSGHWGLPGMHERAKRIGAQLEVWSELGSRHGGRVEHSRVHCLRDIPRPRAASGFSERGRNRIMSTGPSLIRILTVDDHPMLREGIAALVASQPDMKLVAEASTGREALKQFRKHRPDLTLMDLQMPEMNGIEAMIAIRSEFPEARIIVLTTYKGDVQVLRALKAGARAYLLKGLLRKELLETIRAVHAGQKRIPPDVAAELADHAVDDALTSREIDVLRLIAGGNANKLVADQLSITEETVKGHVKNILSKLGASDRTHAVTIALKRGIIEL